MAARTRFFRARSLILSPSKRSIARHALPPRPALKSLSGSGRLAPWAKVSFTLSLWALPTAIIPSRDHTGLPIHFHSSIISRSASRMFLRMLANALPRQSVSPAISSSIRSDGFIDLYTSNSCSVFMRVGRAAGRRPTPRLRAFVVRPAKRSADASPAAPLDGIRQREQVQTGDQEQGEREHGQRAHPSRILAPYHGDDVDDDGHREGHGQPAVGLPNPFVPVQCDLL